MRAEILLFLPVAAFCVTPAIYESHNMRNLKLPSNCPIGGLIYRLKAYDPDPEPLTFGLSGEGPELLEVRMLEGDREADVYLIAPMLKAEFDLGVFVTDGKSTTHVQSTIRVTEPQPLRPAFLDPEPVLSVPEDAERNAVVGRIAARGRDGSGVPATFEIRGSNRFSHKYTLGPERTSIANIVVADELDYETRNLYTLTVLALNGWTNETVDTRNIQEVRVVVTVGDVQDTPPMVLGTTPAVVRVQDLQLPKGHVLFTVDARDGDVESPNNLTFSLATGQEEWQDVFGVDKDTGSVFVAGNLSQLADMNREDHLVLAIAVTEVSPQRAQTTTQVAVVLDVGRDRPPRFLQSVVTGEIDEHSPRGYAVQWDSGTVAALVDPDKGRNASFEVHLEGDQGTFVASPSRGQSELDLLLVVRDSRLLDYEIFPVMEFKIVARGVASQEEVTADVIIRLRDINDHVPLFTQARYEVQLAEHAPQGTSLITLEAHDRDQGLFGTLVFAELTGHLAEALSVDPASGVVTVANSSSLDYETLPTFTCYAEVRDGGGLRAFAELFVALEDVNDHAPHFYQDRYQALLNSDLSGFTEPLVVQAHDEDGPGRNSELHYEILEGNYHDKFTIHDGRIALRESLRPFAGFLDVVVLTVRVYDLGVPSRQASVKVYIHNQKFLNRTLQVVLPRPAEALMRTDTERGLSLLTGAQVYVLDVKPHNDSPASQSELSTWASYPLSASLDLRQLDSAIRLIYGGDLVLSHQQVSTDPTADVRFWVLLAVLILLLLILLIVAAYCLCCRRDGSRSEVKIGPKEANGDAHRTAGNWRPLSGLRKPPETTTILRPQVEANPQVPDEDSRPKRTEILYIRSPELQTQQEDDSDSGLGKDPPAPAGLRLKKGSMLAKKSLFTIAYDGMHTRHLRSNGERPVSP